MAGKFTPQYEQLGFESFEAQQAAAGGFPAPYVGPADAPVRPYADAQAEFDKALEDKGDAALVGATEPGTINQNTQAVLAQAVSSVVVAPAADDTAETPVEGQAGSGETPAS